MSFLTPPPTGRKQTIFTKSRRLEYYEDLYGETNPDEELDRFPDDCEEESSSSDGKSTASNENSESEKKQEGFFARFRKTKPEQSASKLIERRNFGGRQRSKGSVITDSSTADNNITGDPHLDSASRRRRQSTPTREKKRLTPRKGGVFASSFTRMNFDYSTPNSAGEMMEDMFRAGAESAIDFDEGYAEDDFTRQLQEAAYPEIDPELLAEDEIFTAKADDAMSNTKVEMQEGEDADVEDNVEATAFEKPAKAKGAKKATSLLSSALATHKPGAAKANTKSKIDKAPPLPSRIAKPGPAARPKPARKTAAKAKAAEIQPKNTAEKTTRIVTSRNKPAVFQVKRMSAEELCGGRGGRNTRLRNWKGDVIKQDDARGIVVVCTKEEDAEGYERIA